MAAFLSFFETIKLIITSVKEIMAFIEANKREAWFQDATATFSKIKEAKTDDERRAAAAGLRDIFQRL